MRPIINLAGEVFNHLTVLSRVENQGTQPAWLCKCICGNNVIVQGGRLRSNRTKSCGCLNRIGEHSRYQGIMFNNGYKLIKSPDPNHPHQYRKGYVYEHRYVMEQHIGRYLDPTEKVHHKNHIISDNRIENLVLCKNDSDHHAIYHSDINLHRRVHGPTCPRCESNETHSYDSRSWYCRSCKRQFVKSGNVRKHHPPCPFCGLDRTRSYDKTYYQCHVCRRCWRK